MKAIADEEHAARTDGTQRPSCSLKALPGVAALRHDEQGIRRYAELFKIPRPDFGLARFAWSSRSADEDKSTGVPLTIEGRGVVKPCTEGTGWPTIVLRRTEDQNGIGGSSLVVACLRFDC